MASTVGGVGVAVFGVVATSDVLPGEFGACWRHEFDDVVAGFERVEGIFAVRSGGGGDGHEAGFCDRADLSGRWVTVDRVAVGVEKVDGLAGVAGLGDTFQAVAVRVVPQDATDRGGLEEADACLVDDLVGDLVGGGGDIVDEPLFDGQVARGVGRYRDGEAGARSQRWDGPHDGGRVTVSCVDRRFAEGVGWVRAIYGGVVVAGGRTGHVGEWVGNRVGDDHVREVFVGRVGDLDLPGHGSRRSDKAELLLVSVLGHLNTKVGDRGGRGVRGACAWGIRGSWRSVWSPRFDVDSVDDLGVGVRRWKEFELQFDLCRSVDGAEFPLEQGRAGADIGDCGFEGGTVRGG